MCICTSDNLIIGFPDASPGANLSSVWQKVEVGVAKFDMVRTDAAAAATSDEVERR